MSAVGPDGRDIAVIEDCRLAGLSVEARGGVSGTDGEAGAAAWVLVGVEEPLDDEDAFDSDSGSADRRNVHLDVPAWRRSDSCWLWRCVTLLHPRRVPRARGLSTIEKRRRRKTCSIPTRTATSA
jgi:hypothetical protein